MLRFSIGDCWKMGAFFKVVSYVQESTHTISPSTQGPARPRAPWFLLLGHLQFVCGDVIHVWKMKSSPRYNSHIKKTKVKSQLKSVSLGIRSCSPQATRVPRPLNFVSTLSDSYPFPRPKFLTPGWTDMNVLAGITELNVWYVGCLVNLNWMIMLCTVASAVPWACPLGHLRDGKISAIG